MVMFMKPGVDALVRTSHHPTIFWIAFGLVTSITFLWLGIKAFYIWYEEREEKKRIVYIMPDGRGLKHGDYVVEKAMPHSGFEQVKTLPPFQAMVMASLDGKNYHVMGQCYWVDEGIVTAAHVVDGFEYLCIYRDESHKINIRSDWFEIGHGDYAVCRKVEKITQALGLAKAKFSRLAVQKGSGLSANIVAMGVRTIGFLDRHPHFGFVQYSGSTAKGFSGAPYYFGRTVFGMHLGADSKNMGYDGAFLRSELKPSRLIQKELSLRTEDSANWLIGQLDRYAEEVEYIRSPYNSEEYKIRVGNMYHIIDEEVLDAILRKGKAKRNNPDDIDYLPEAIPKSVNAKTEKFEPEALFVDGRKPEKPKHSDLAQEDDPREAMIRGLLAEWGRTSLYQKESRDVETLPLAPRNAMSFDDSENLIRAPHASVGARGTEKVRESVQNQEKQTCQKMGYEYQTPLVTYHTESRIPTLAQPNEASARTLKNKNKRINRQHLMRAFPQCVQLLRHIQAGELTSEQLKTAADGLMRSLPEHLKKLT
uniref:Uncharacterized protein n=1 Tax=Atrato Sobemo-like virus 5 TaxID=2689351 RepID=A0A6B9KGZ5_9VIRU|nr:hypothetical protein [Atrato Sobemo-like virus 5]